MTKPKAIDLFCGCGGLTQGLRDAGFYVIAGVENEPLAVKSFRFNHRKTKVWNKNIDEITPEAMMERHGLEEGDLDLLAGCPPCQGFSSIRRLNGKRKIHDKRKDLVFRFVDFVETMMPKVIMMENVPRLTEDHRMVQKVIPKLRKLGYIGKPRIFNAADFGVPQRRRRMIYVASRIGEIDYASPIPKEERGTVRQAIQALALPGDSGDAIHDFPESRSKAVMDIIRCIPKDGGSRRNMPEKYQLKCHKKKNTGFKDVYGRMAWDDVSPTITGGCINPSKGRFLHPQQDRAITLREAALLQSFPQDYVFPLDRGKYAVGLIIGNAFPPKFAEPHARKIVVALKGLK